MDIAKHLTKLRYAKTDVQALAFSRDIVAEFERLRHYEGALLAEQEENELLRAELTECREVLKQLYNVTLFDYDLMPEFYRKEAHQIVRETVRDALVAKGE